jgi:lipopolysaccharide transport system permease protein
MKPIAAAYPETRPLLRLHRTIRPPAGVVQLDLKEFWAYRDLLVTLAIRDVRLRYRQTALGIFWVVLQPLIAAGIFTFVFQRVGGFSGNGIPYFALTFAGQIGWMAFSGTLTKSSASLVGNSGLVSKVYFPRLILPISTVASTFVDFGVGFVVLLAVMPFLHLFPFWGIITLPIWLLLIIFLSLGVGLFFSSLMVRFRDVAYIVPVLLQMLMFGSPVLYPLHSIISKMSPEFAFVYLVLNPFAPLVEAFRWSLFGQSDVPWEFVAYAACMSLLILFLGAILFRQQERQFADVI